MSNRHKRDTAELQQINLLLQTALALPEARREAWLQALPPPHRALMPSLRALLLRASEETDGFMRRSAVRLRGPHASSSFRPGSALQLQDRPAMNPHSRPDTHPLQQLNTLLETALELPDSQREAWLQALPTEQRALAPLLRAMLQRASVETDDFMRQPAGLATVLADRSRIAVTERRTADALQLAERALAVAENSRGDLPHSATSGEAWLAVARARHAAGDNAAAREACALAVRHLAATLDDSHPSLADARALAALIG